MMLLSLTISYQNKRHTSLSYSHIYTRSLALSWAIVATGLGRLHSSILLRPSRVASPRTRHPLSPTPHSSCTHTHTYYCPYSLKHVQVCGVRPTPGGLPPRSSHPPTAPTTQPHKEGSRQRMRRDSSSFSLHLRPPPAYSTQHTASITHRRAVPVRGLALFLAAGCCWWKLGGPLEIALCLLAGVLCLPLAHSNSPNQTSPSKTRPPSLPPSLPPSSCEIRLCFRRLKQQ